MLKIRRHERVLYLGVLTMSKLYKIKNKNVDGWFKWYEVIYQYMRIRPIKGLYYAIKRIIEDCFY